MRYSYNTVKQTASIPLPDTCRRCGSNSFSTEPAKPPHHLASRCRSCGLFAKFISKKDLPQSNPYPQIYERVRADFNSPRDDSHESCHERFERLEKALADYDSQLGILVRAIVGCGVLQGRGAAPSRVHVDDELVSRLVGELAEGGAGR
jgi:hypothetical protein